MGTPRVIRPVAAYCWQGRTPHELGGCLPRAAAIWRQRWRVAGDRIEQRLRLRAEPPLSEATVLVRGGPDTEDKLARHAHRTARAWSFDGKPPAGDGTIVHLRLLPGLVDDYRQLVERAVAS